MEDHIIKDFLLFHSEVIRRLSGWRGLETTVSTVSLVEALRLDWDVIKEFPKFMRLIRALYRYVKGNLGRAASSIAMHQCMGIGYLTYVRKGGIPSRGITIRIYI